MACPTPSTGFRTVVRYTYPAQPERFHSSAGQPSQPSVMFRTFWTEQYDLALGVEKPRAGQGDERKQINYGLCK